MSWIPFQKQSFIHEDAWEKNLKTSWLNIYPCAWIDQFYIFLRRGDWLIGMFEKFGNIHSVRRARRGKGSMTGWKIIRAFPNWRFPSNREMIIPEKNYLVQNFVLLPIFLHSPDQAVNGITRIFRPINQQKSPLILAYNFLVYFKICKTNLNLRENAACTCCCSCA